MWRVGWKKGQLAEKTAARQTKWKNLLLSFKNSRVRIPCLTSPDLLRLFMPPAALAFCRVSGLWSTALPLSFPRTQYWVTENKHQAIQWAALSTFLANCLLQSSLKIISSHFEEYYPLDSWPSKSQVLILLLRGKTSQQGTLALLPCKSDTRDDLPDCHCDLTSSREKESRARQYFLRQ